MSKIKNGGLDQYDAEPFEQHQTGTDGVERVNTYLPKKTSRDLDHAPVCHHGSTQSRWKDPRTLRSVNRGPHICIWEVSNSLAPALRTCGCGCNQYTIRYVTGCYDATFYVTIILLDFCCLDISRVILILLARCMCIIVAKRDIM